MHEAGTSAPFLLSPTLGLRLGSCIARRRYLGPRADLRLSLPASVALLAGCLPPHARDPCGTRASAIAGGGPRDWAKGAHAWGGERQLLTDAPVSSVSAVQLLQQTFPFNQHSDCGESRRRPFERDVRERTAMGLHFE